MARLVEPVRILEVRVREAKLFGFRVHQPDETIGRSSPDVKRERFGRIVGTRDERRAQELGDRELLTRTEVDRRLADARSLWAHADDIVQLRVLEDDQCGHELRDAGNRAGIGRAMTSEHGAVASHEVPGGSRDLRLGGLSAGARDQDGCRECSDESDDGERCSAHQRATMYWPRLPACGGPHGSGELLRLGACGSAPVRLAVAVRVDHGA